MQNGQDRCSWHRWVKRIKSDFERWNVRGCLTIWGNAEPSFSPSSISSCPTSDASRVPGHSSTSSADQQQTSTWGTQRLSVQFILSVLILFFFFCASYFSLLSFSSSNFPPPYSSSLYFLLPLLLFLLCFPLLLLIAFFSFLPLRSPFCLVILARPLQPSVSV